jgi:hypothetical protein
MLANTTPSTPTTPPGTINQLISKHLLWRGEPTADENLPLSCHHAAPNNTQSIPLISATPLISAIPLISVTHNTTNDSLLPLVSTISLKRGAIHEFIYNDPLQPNATPVSLASVIAVNAHLSLSQNRLRDRDTLHRNLTTPHLSIIWIGKRCWPTPFALDALTPLQSPYRDLNGTLKSSLFIDTTSDKETLWAIENALTNRSIQLVIADCPKISPSTSQRLALLADRNNRTAILLRAVGDLHSRSFAHSRWELTPTPSNNSSPSWLLTLHRVKSGAIKCDNHDYAATLKLTHDKRWCVSLDEQVLGLPCNETPLICNEVRVDDKHFVTKRAAG